MSPKRVLDPIEQDNATREPALQHPLTRCILCDAQAEIVGVFVPDVPERWGARPGRGRIIAYGLCQPCFARPDKAARVEEAIRQGLEGGVHWLRQAAGPHQ